MAPNAPKGPWLPLVRRPWALNTTFALSTTDVTTFRRATLFPVRRLARPNPKALPDPQPTLRHRPSVTGLSPSHDPTCIRLLVTLTAQSKISLPMPVCARVCCVTALVPKNRCDKLKLQSDGLSRQEEFLTFLKILVDKSLELWGKDLWVSCKTQ